MMRKSTELELLIVHLRKEYTKETVLILNISNKFVNIQCDFNIHIFEHITTKLRYPFCNETQI